MARVPFTGSPRSRGNRFKRVDLLREIMHPNSAANRVRETERGIARLERLNIGTPAVIEAPAVGAVMITGTYTGDGSTLFRVPVGFRPKWVRVWEQETAENLAPASDSVLEATEDMVTDNANGIAFAPVGGDFLESRILAFYDFGFEVSDDTTDENPNTSGQVYNYMAFA